MDERPSDEAITRAPKVLLHDHLDGGLRPATVVELAAEYGYDRLPTTDVDELAAWFVGGGKRVDLVQYLEAFDHTVGVMQHRDALARVAAECAEDLAADGVRYAEIRFAPEQHLEAGLDLDEVVEAVMEGFALGSAGRPITVYALLSAMRTAARSREIAELAVRWRDAGVVGFDIAGAEAGFPPTRHLDAFQYVERENFHTTIHAGEAFGLPSIWEALQWCGAERLGHGVRIVDDLFVEDGHYQLGRLAAYVRDRRIPLEMCPTSNVNTGAAPSIEQHPIGVLRRLRFRVTVNTDNRLMSATSMTRELSQLRDAFGYGWDDFEWLTVNAMKSAFAPFDERLRIINEQIKPQYAMLKAAGLGVSAVVWTGPQARSGHRLGRFTTMPSCVLRAITTTASSSAAGFSSRCGHERRHEHVVARLGLDAHLGVALGEHEHRVPGHHVDRRLRFAVVMVARRRRRRHVGLAHPQLLRPHRLARDGLEPAHPRGLGGVARELVGGDVVEHVVPGVVVVAHAAVCSTRSCPVLIAVVRVRTPRTAIKRGWRGTSRGCGPSRRRRWPRGSCRCARGCGSRGRRRGSGRPRWPPAAVAAAARRASTSATGMPWSRSPYRPEPRGPQARRQLDQRRDAVEAGGGHAAAVERDGGADLALDGRGQRHRAAHAEAHDAGAAGGHAAGGQPRQGGVDVAHDAVARQGAHHRPHRGEVVVGEHRVAGAVEQVRGDGQVAVGRQPAHHVFDIAVHAEGFLDHHDAGAVRLARLGHREGYVVEGLDHGTMV